MRTVRGVLRVIAGQHDHAAAAGAGKVRGFLGKFIADAQRIVGGQLGVLKG